jgi:ABC-2 type transport system permease protein
MTAATTAATPTPAGRVLALATTEVRLILRNKTVAVSSVVLPIGLGVLWAFQFGGVDDPARHAVSITLQLAVALAMGVYLTATQTLVARRHSGVLKRMRTSGLSDRGLIVATLAPTVVLGVVQLVVFAVVNVGTGAPSPNDPGPLVLAVLGGLALVVTAALATSIVTPSPERAQITTLPLMFVMLGVGVVAAIAPGEGWWPALSVVPGGALGDLAQLAMTGGSWAAGAAGLPAIMPPLAALVAWPLVLGAVALRRFRWDPRH